MQKAKRHLLALDPDLKDLFARHRGLKFVPMLERAPYESLVRAVANQQLHGKAAQTILNRMIALNPSQPFPSPEDLLALSEEQLRACGFSKSKIKAIHDIARKTVEGTVPSAHDIQEMSNHEIIERLTTIFGVGRWTVEMLLIFQLGRLNVWPVDDFGVRRGLEVWKKKRKPLTVAQLRILGKKWEPYQTVVALYLWREADLAKVPKTKIK